MSKIYNKRPIAILMATYNGEKYLSEQIESIISQTNHDWTLYIQDDGSTDSTVEVIKSYADSDRIVNVDVGLSRQGAAMNFMSLLNIVESDCYMFSDQDDIWLPDKVELSCSKVKEIEKKHPDSPVLVHTDKKRVDSNLNVILESELNRNEISIEKLQKVMKERNSLSQLRLGTFIAGCVMCFNRKAKEVSFPFINARMHDSIIAMAVASHGGIIYTIFESMMLYRIHSTNTCGVAETKMLEKLQHISKLLSGNSRMFYLWKIYGGGNFGSFLYHRYRLFATKGF